MNPGIECTFSIKGNRITHIALKPQIDNLLQWKIEGEGADSLKQDINRWVEIYLSGQQPDFYLPLDFAKITPFTLQVLHQIQRVPFGKTVAYFDIAQRLNKPQAARAVGQACGRNPFPLVIPCHRILAKDQTIGGFSCGLSIKHFLLSHENVVT